MVEQPTGTVTLVFTDIEGSTRLLRDLGEASYRAALAEHRRVVREACDRHGGYEVDHEGDAFFYAFASARAAVAAVGHAMQELGGGPIRVRVGIHTGEPVLDPPKYVGLDVHQAARIMSAAHGGQVLLSASTRDLVDADVTGLGEHRLKDFDEPIELFQLGSGRFPQLKTLSHTNLPRPASSFVGRKREVSDVVELVRGPARLVTLSGPGGSGKTRLAVEAASEVVSDFDAGVYWVGLSGLRDPALVRETIGQTLGNDNPAAHVGSRELLLVLDNFEQVVDAAPELGTLLEACPHLKCVVTTREVLRIRGEEEYPVPPLQATEAVELFCARSRFEPDETIAELCRRLDDLPLALELAAARASVLSPAQILDRLSQRLDLLKGGRDAESRQQTLRAAIEWSHDLLNEEEQRLLAGLSVFAGGCTLEAAEAVVGADIDTLQSLVDKSLLRNTKERFWMLHTIREYAAEKLAANPPVEQATRKSYAAAFLDLAEEAEVHLNGPDRHTWEQRLSAELDNLRSTGDYFAATEAWNEALRLVCALDLFWDRAGLAREGTEYLETALVHADGASAPLRAKAHTVAAALYISRGDMVNAARPHVEAGLPIARATGDDALLAEILIAASLTHVVQGGDEQALDKINEALECALRCGDDALIGRVLANRASIRALGSDPDKQAAYEDYAAARERLARIGATSQLPSLLSNLGWLALCEGDLEAARAHLQEGLAFSADSRHSAYVTSNLANVAILEDDFVAAAGLAENALLACREFSLDGLVPECVAQAAICLTSAGSLTSAAQLHGAAEALTELHGLNADWGPMAVRAREDLSRLREAMGEHAFTAAYNAGRGLTTERTTELAIEQIALLQTTNDA